MTNTDTRNVEATVGQIRRLEQAGCEIIRVAVLDEEAAAAIRAIKQEITIPLVADIHFDYKLALKSLAAGADGLRINPGNIGDGNKVAEIVAACQDRQIPIRIGVNAGSLDKQKLEKHGGVCAEAMVDSALDNVKILEDLDFHAIKISLKASSVLLTLAAYRQMADQVDYPLHIGITEAGTKDRALITCGRCEIDLIRLAEEIDVKIRSLPEPLKVAVMGCVVNGPGEAREADVGIAGGRGFGLLFRKGEIIKKVPEGELVTALMTEIAEIKPCQRGVGDENRD